MREIEGAEAVIAGRAKTISGVRALGPYRLRIRLTQPVGDFTARLTMAFFCPILRIRRQDPKGIDDPAGPGLLRRRARRQPARDPEAQPALPRQPPGERRRDRGPWHEPGELPGSHRGGPDRPLRGVRDPADGVPATGRHVRRQPAGRAVLRQPAARCVVLRLQSRAAGLQGPGQIPLKKAINFALDRRRSARPSATWAACPTTSC